MRYKPKRAPEGINSSSESPLGDALFLVSLTVGIIIVSFFALSIFTSLIAKKIDLHTEAAFFQKETDSPPSTKSQALQEVVDKLWAHYPESKKMALQATAIPSKDLNAFMGIGGTLGVTEELMNQVKYENELAFAVCHEIGHFYNRDVLQGMGRKLGLAVVLSFLGFGDSADIVSLGTDSIGSAFDRKQEEKADSFALDCMHQHYGHVQGYDQFFKLVIKEESSHKIGRPKALSFLQSHPLTEKRMEKLERKILEKNYVPHGKLTRLNY